MDVVLFALALLALAAFVAAPLYRSTASGERIGTSDTDPRTDALARALRDLEIDRESGLLDDISYAEERAVLERELDELRRP
jgi:cytochrome c-type biogenesis protein CcmH/NrfG